MDNKVHPDNNQRQHQAVTTYQQPLDQNGQPYLIQPYHQNQQHQNQYQGAVPPNGQIYQNPPGFDPVPMPLYSTASIQNRMYNSVLPPVIDFGIIPEGAIFYSNNCPALDKPTIVEYKLTDGGNIESFDETLDSDVIQTNKEEELWRYFMCNLKAPNQLINIRGHHRELRKVTREVNGQKQIVDEEHEVVDYDFYIDMNHYVSPAWSRIICQPIPGQPPKGYKQTLKEYTGSDRNIKEIHMKK